MAFLGSAAPWLSLRWKVLPVVNNASFSSITYGNGVLLAVGDIGTTARSLDGGYARAAAWRSGGLGFAELPPASLTWQIAAPITSRNLVAVDADRLGSLAVAVGMVGTIIRTTNGGATWSLVQVRQRVSGRSHNGVTWSALCAERVQREHPLCGRVRQQPRVRRRAARCSSHVPLPTRCRVCRSLGAQAC